jgi:hypothetical protein
MDIKIDLSTGDIDVKDFVGPRLFTLSENLNAIGQRILIRLRTFAGEWFLDQNEGIPYFQRILGQQNPQALETMRVLLRNKVASTEGVLSVESFDVSFTGDERLATVSFKARTTAGTVNFTNENIHVNSEDGAGLSSLLSNLVVSLGSLSPSFNSGIDAYTDAVNGGAAEIVLTPTAVTPASIITVNGTPVISGNSIAVPLSTWGSNVATIVVTGGVNVSTYTLTINKSTAGATRILNPSPSNSDNFGRSVACYGDTVVVGVPFEDSNTSTINSTPNELAADKGAVYVFRRTAGVWAVEAYLKSSNVGTNFGASVAIYGDTIVVGSPSDINGSAYVFTRSGTTWTQQQRIAASNGEAGDNFGASVSIWGDSIIVGAYSEASNATGVGGNQSDNSLGSCGAAYVFTRSAGVWSQQAYLKAMTASASLFFGYAVAIHENTVVVGAFGADINLADSGAVYVYFRTGSTWAHQQTLLGGVQTASDLSAISVAIYGDTIVFGSRFEDSSTSGVNSTPNESSSGAGAAWVFVRSAGVWSQQAYLKASNPEPDDNFGDAVAIWGDTIVVGAPNEDSNAINVNGNQANNSNVGAGAAYVFTRNGTTWSQAAYLKSTTGAASSSFGGNTSYFNNPKGNGVAVCTDAIVVGAFNETSAQGAAYIF